eukprot:675096-Hanusia_phi.AAC.1
MRGGRGCRIWEEEISCDVSAVKRCDVCTCQVDLLICNLPLPILLGYLLLLPPPPPPLPPPLLRSTSSLRPLTSSPSPSPLLSLLRRFITPPSGLRSPAPPAPAHVRTQPSTWSDSPQCEGED